MSDLEDAAAHEAAMKYARGVWDAAQDVNLGEVDPAESGDAEQHRARYEAAKTRQREDDYRARGRTIGRAPTE